jgi:hypothetical protein
LLRDVTASDEGEGDADAEDESGDAVDEWNRRREGRPGGHLRQWEHDVVHDAIKSYSEESAIEPGMLREGKLTGGEEESGCGTEGDEEVADQAEEGGAASHAEDGSAVDATGDALEDSDGRHAAQTVKDEGIRDVESADEERGTSDDLPERGMVRRVAINGHFHLE